MGKAIIGEYRESDLEAMTKLWNEIVEIGQAFPQDEPLASTEAADFFRSQSYCAVARDEKTGDFLGLYILHPNNVGRCGHICNASYAVKGQARNSGTGRALVEHSLAQAAALGFRIIQFNAVVADNLAALHLYEKLGFNALGTIREGFRSKSGEYKDIKLFWRSL